jgi:hypothetical protein
MHHLLPLYGRNQRRFLRIYIWLAKLTRIPIIGLFVRVAANRYAISGHGAFVLKPSEVEAIIDASDYVALTECSCRQVFGNCDNPITTEIVIGYGREVYKDAKDNELKPVSKTEAKKVAADCHRRELISSLIHCGGHYYSICNCCSCCCVPFRLKKNYGINLSFRREPDIVISYKNKNFD